MTRRGPRGDEGASLPVVALVGRPNVGKSSLFNRLVGGRPALVEDRPGVTRDRRYGVCEWDGARFRIVDTGGLDPSAEGILAAMRAQTLRAVEEAAAIVFMLDAAEGITAVDHDVARLLRRSGKPLLVAVNKVDSGAREGATAEAFALGFDKVFPVSASHGRGIGELLDAAVAIVGRPEESPAPSGSPAEDHPPIRLAFVGKPNVGKSSLVNRLLGQERVLVHDAPGTTRDPIDTPFSTGGREYVLVDTAGMRRRRSIDTMTEHVAAKMARDQVARCDVAALVIDGRTGATAEDARLGSLIEEAGCAALVVLNKSDLLPRAEVDRRVAAAREELAFLGWAPFLLTSALTGRGVAAIPGDAARVWDQWSRRIPTGELNRFFESIVERQPPPAGPGGRHVRLYYVTQASVRPPTFVVSTNQPTAVPVAYRRFLTNQLRKAYGFEGAPLRVVMRARRQKRRTGSPAGKSE